MRKIGWGRAAGTKPEEANSLMFFFQAGWMGTTSAKRPVRRLRSGWEMYVLETGVRAGESFYFLFAEMQMLCGYGRVLCNGSISFTETHGY